MTVTVDAVVYYRVSNPTMVIKLMIMLRMMMMMMMMKMMTMMIMMLMISLLVISTTGVEEGGGAEPLIFHNEFATWMENQQACTNNDYDFDYDDVYDDD